MILQAKENDCLTNDDFNLVKKYLIKNGEQVKLYKAGIMADTSELSIQLLLENKTIALVEYQDEYQIVVIDKNDKEKIPAYFVSNKKNPCEISAYYSMLDTDESTRNRGNNWCEIVTKIKNVNKR